jgi:A/G-specific adenine glycosylase
MDALSVTTHELQLFKNGVWQYYAENKRSFPWRDTYNPYFITVSEIMLQQTQTDRVLPKYEAFIHTFPTVEALAVASLSDVLAQWQGLGYNRRGMFLKKLGEDVVSRFHGLFPHTIADLDSLPGIGYATACAIAAYAYQQPTVFIETNIRTVFIHHFFAESEPVTDAQIMPLVERAVDHDNPREWYYALMDYGVYLKKMHANPSRKSAHYTKQSKFTGSDRQLRGKLLRYMLKNKEVDRDTLYADFASEHLRIDRVLSGMVKDGMLKSLDTLIVLE